MSDPQNPGSGAPGGTSGAGPSVDSTQPQKTETTSPRTVSWENHQRALDDMHKFKQQVQQLEAKLGDMQSESLKEKNDYKSLYEQTSEKLKSTEQKLTQQSDWIVKTQQFNEVKAAAVAAGLRSEALEDLDLIDMSGVKVEATSTGRFLVSGAKERVESLKKEKPHWFTVDRPPTINAGGTGAGESQPGRRLTAVDVHQAERDWRTRKISEAQYRRIYKQYCDENPKFAIPAGEPNKPQTQ